MSYRDQELPEIEQGLIDEVMPLLRTAVQRRMDAQVAEDALTELLRCDGQDLTVLTTTLANTVESVDVITEDHVILFIDQVNYLTSCNKDGDDEDDDDDQSVDDTCVLCGEDFSVGDDSWDDLDPECADRVSAYMDEHKVERGVAIEALKNVTVSEN
jgi:hypothetical protein